MLDVLGSIWTWLDGKKTYLGLAITVLSAVLSFFGVVAPVLGVSAVLVAKISGVITLILGLLHKAAKATGQE